MQPEYEHTPAMFRNHPLGFILCLLLVPVGVGIVILIYWYFKATSLKLTLAGNAVHVERGFFSKERIDIDARKIRTVVVNQTFWQRIMNVGTVEIFTGGDDAECILPGMPEPNRIRSFVQSRNLKADEAEA